MWRHKNHSGFAIAIAWPETYCKQPGNWYDGLANFLGISDNHYYKVGHAAVVLVDSETSKCHYFDFGRYHAPFQHGRVRSEQTDDGLKMGTVALISEDGRRLENFEEILTELQLNQECHGEGGIHASYCSINFRDALSKASYFQQKSPIPYGPFKYEGSNCSRFVNTIILAGKPSWEASIKLNYLVPFTPMPLNNVNSLENKLVLPKRLTNDAFCPGAISDKSKLKRTLPQPSRPENIPESAQWLSGEGSGSWFSISQLETTRYTIIRFGPNGEMECKGEFNVCNNLTFDISQPFRFEHLSHCRKIKVRQKTQIIELHRIDLLSIVI